MSVEPFRFDPAADIYGTSNHGYVDIIPAKLVDRFGNPSDGDLNRVSGAFTFTDANGNVFTVYDYWWEGLGEDEEFWSKSDLQEDVSIGAKIGVAPERVNAFIDWILSIAGSESD